MKALIFAGALLFSFTAMAESSSRSTLAEFKESRSHRLLPLNHLFLSVLPLPFLTDSWGVALETVIIPNLTLFGAMDREDTGYNEGILDWSFGPDADFRKEDVSFGVRYYLREAGASSWYAGAGYKWGSVQSSAYTAFQTNEDKTERFQGAYGTVGYRFLLGDTRRFTWLADINTGYEPGEVAVSKDANGYEKVEVGYNVSGEARIGINF